MRPRAVSVVVLRAPRPHAHALPPSLPFSPSLPAAPGPRPTPAAVAVAHSSVHFLAPFPSPYAKASPPPDESIRRPTLPPPLFACEVFTLSAPTLEERALFDHDREGLSVAR
ncbi:hypothetical protein B0H14DRAFT_3525476 [Mycena olivaceomarginata]|nr:hypothetical protein B0H14DRAFT_3525476 [Mycena olivaceomarginata]